MVTQKIPPENAPPGEGSIVEMGKRQYLIVPRRGSLAARAAIQPLSADVMKGLIGNIPDIDVVRVLQPKKGVSTFSTRPNEANEAYVVKMDRNRAELLKQTAPPHLIVEQDRFLDYGGMVRPSRSEIPEESLKSTKGLRSVPVKFRILGEGDAPLTNAKVTLQGDAFPQDGVTDKNGEVTLTLHTVGESPPRSLFVVVPKDYWDRFILTPDVSLTEVNVVRMFSLRQWLSGFPASYKFGWGQRLMGLDQLPEHLTGKGVKIAIIDSGADNMHPLLRHIQIGMDMTNGQDARTWSQDVVGHGTHCAGVITGRSTDQAAFRGFAPEAEIHVFKIFPGGQFSNLIEALDQCMALDIDIVNMSLGSDQISQAVEQKLEEAVHDGVACIVAAGNSGGPVQYPASSPNVLAVAAVGRLKEHPSESWDARTITAPLVTPDGLFSPTFTCFGPQVGVSAPGVSIVSTVPDNGFEPQSGTSMAAPHVAGFAALLLAHHPVFQGPMRARGPQRVAALFSLIKSACVPSPLGPERTGCGIPNLSSLVQVLAAPQPATGAASQPQASPEAAAQPAPVPPGGAAVAAPTPAPQPGPQALPLPPGVDPSLWQTIIWPQVAGLLAAPGGVQLLLQLLAQGRFGPQLGGYISALLGQALAGGMFPAAAAPAQAPPLTPQGAVPGQFGQIFGQAGGVIPQTPFLTAPWNPGIWSTPLF